MSGPHFCARESARLVTMTASNGAAAMARPNGPADEVPTAISTAHPTSRNSPSPALMNLYALKSALPAKMPQAMCWAHMGTKDAMKAAMRSVLPSNKRGRRTGERPAATSMRANAITSPWLPTRRAMGAGYRPTALAWDS